MDTRSDRYVVHPLNLVGVGVGLLFSASVGWASPAQMPEAAIAQQGLSNALSTTGTLVAETGDIVDVATADGSFTTLLSLFDDLGMAEDLRGYGRFTVFAPTDAAFAAVPENVMTVLQSDRDLMAKVLAYHVIASAEPLTSDDISGSMSVRTLERSEVEIDRRGGTIYVNDARVVDANIEAVNGVIHAIDQVLIPPDVVSALR
jgi:uncharacterized surface protein with fasciclin (FAS1) repeats